MGVKCDIFNFRKNAGNKRMSKRQYIGHTIMTLCSQSIFYASVPSRVPGSLKTCARMNLKQKHIPESIEENIHVKI